MATVLLSAHGEKIRQSQLNNLDQIIATGGRYLINITTLVLE